MNRKRKIVLTALSIALGGTFISALANTIVYKESPVLAESLKDTNEFKKIADGWNPNSSDFGHGYCHYVFEFKYPWRSSGTGIDENKVEDFKNSLQINGVALKDINNYSDIRIHYAHGGKYFAIKFPTSFLVAEEGSQYCVVHIDDETEFYDYCLPDMTISINASTYEASVIAKTVSMVDFKGIIWNMTNEDEALFGDKNGLLIGIGEDFYDGTSDNIVDTIGHKVLFNGNAFSTLTNAEIRIYNSNKLWLYADELNTVNGDKNTLSMSSAKYNGKVMGKFTFYLESGQGKRWSSYYGTGTVNPTVYYDSKTDSYGSAWPSNRVYEGQGRHYYCGGNYDSGEKNGYLLSFNEKLSLDYYYYDGNYNYHNLAKENIGYQIKNNGIPFAEIEGAEIFYHSAGHIWLYTPTLTCPKEGTNYAEITIDEGTTFFNALLPALHIYHEDLYDFSKFSEANLWHIVGYSGYEGPTDYNPSYLTLDEKCDYQDTWLGPYGWNNHGGDGTTIIAYGDNQWDVKENPDDPDYETTFLNYNEKGEIQIIQNNIASKDFAIGYKMKLNGMPICQIDGAVVNYQNGENFFSFTIPERSCVPFNGYKLPTLTLEDHTNFFKRSLQGFTIYFYDGIWHKEPTDTISDKTLTEAAQYYDVFSNGDFNSEVTTELGLVPQDKDAITFEMRTESKLAAFAMNVFSSEDYKGLNVLFDLPNNNIMVADASKSSTYIGKGTYNYEFELEEWTRVYIQAKRNENAISFVIAIDDYIVVKENLVSVDDINGYGNKALIYTNGESVELRNSMIGYDIKRPSLIYYGKDTYRYYVGDEFIDLLPCFEAYDCYTNITDSIQLDIPEGMLDSENKLNKGNFIVKAYAENSIGTRRYHNINVIVTEPDEVVVTFDGNNPSVYKVGDLITRPEENPTKAPENNISYAFVAWTLNGAEWDFENDYVVQDTNLVALFKPVIQEYLVTFEVSGLKDNSGFTMNFIKGTVINASMFEKEGYQLTMIVNEEEVTSFTVDSDVTVKLIYKIPGEDKPTKSGCGGSIAISSILISISSLIAGGLLLARRKEEK